jgi:nucleoside-diphosphate kinase
MERTFVMLKPSTVTRGIVGAVLARIEDKGLKIVALKMVSISRAKAEKLYAVHKGKPFYESLIAYVTSAPAVTMVVEGEEAVATMRKLVGATNPKEALPGTIRGDLAMDVQKNVVHASDSVENAKTEMSIFFSADELLMYQRADEKWV